MMQEYCSGQDFGLNFTASAQPPPSPPDSVYNKPINIPPAPFYQEPHSPEPESFCKGRSEILLRPASPFPHTPSPTGIPPSSPSELPYTKSSSPAGQSSYLHSKSPSPAIGCPSHHHLDPCEPSSEPFTKSSSLSEESSYAAYSKSLEQVSSQFHLDPGLQPGSLTAHPHYLQEGTESCLHYQVAKTCLHF